MMARIDEAGIHVYANPTFGRKATLVVRKDAKGLDLSQFHFTFEVNQQDYETPNNAKIRVYNLKEETVNSIRGEFDSIVLQAGYEKGAYGTIFAGSLKQFHVGKENNRSSYLDLLCGDGDVGYNFGVIAATYAAGTNLAEVIDGAAEAMGSPPFAFIDTKLGAAQKINIRGKVAWGMARDVMRDAARSLDANWSIQDGQVTMTPLTSYRPGHAVVLDAASGLIGRPELTDDGVSARCLLNPKIRVGGLVQIDQKTINRTIQQSPTDNTRFNSRGGTAASQNANAALNPDGLYQVFVAEHRGDTRGGQWYTDLICLAVQSDTGEVRAFG